MRMTSSTSSILVLSLSCQEGAEAVGWSLPPPGDRWPPQLVGSGGMTVGPRATTPFVTKPSHICPHSCQSPVGSSLRVEGLGSKQDRGVGLWSQASFSALTTGTCMRDTHFVLSEGSSRGPSAVLLVRQAHDGKDCRGRGVHVSCLPVTWPPTARSQVLSPGGSFPST